MAALGPPPPRSPLLPQRGPLLDPEAVLLVDHHDPEGAKADVVAQAGRGCRRRGRGPPSHELGWMPRPLRRPRSDSSTAPTRERTHAQSWRSWVTGTRSSPSNSPRREVVLLGEDLGRDHECALVAALDAVEEGREGDHRLAGTDIAL